MNAKAKELLSNESFLKELAGTNSPEEAQKLFKSKDGEITIVELTALSATIKGSELNDDQLAAVAGGGFADINIIISPQVNVTPQANITPQVALPGAGSVVDAGKSLLDKGKGLLGGLKW
jgi:hypothetical protein